MEENPLKSQVRREKRVNKLGANAVCCICGYANPTALVLAGRTLLENHHAAGKVHDPKPTVPICRNCHAELTAGLLDAGADMRKQPTVLERLAIILLSLGTLFVALGEAMYRYADDILRLVDSLNEHFKNWRRLPEAK
jgi:hypothetical protein